MLSSLRNFFIALFISIIGFGIGAYFLTGFIDDTLNNFINPTEASDDSGIKENETEDPNETEQDDEDEEKDLSDFTMLIIGIDDGKSQFEDKDDDKKIEADTILFVNINAPTETIMMSSMPSNMKTEVGGYILRLGAVYSYGEYTGKGGRGMELMKETIWSYTGVKVDYCFVLDYDSLEIFFNILGEIEYTVPENMYYKPTPYDITTTDPPTEEETTVNNIRINDDTTEETTNRDIIDLKKGKQTIDGATAVQLLRYNNYKDEQYDRTTIQIDFIKEVIRQQMTMENLARAEEIYTELIKILFGDEKVIEDEDYIKTNFKTDFSEEDFKKYTNTLFNLSDYSVKEIVYPSKSAMKVENGILFFDPDVKAAVSRYRDYRKTEKIETTEKIEGTTEIN